jgi:DNA-binding cell septation regulator SpoVG
MTYFKTIPLNLPNLYIAVEQIRHSPKPGPTLAYADVRVGPLVINGVSVVQNPNGGGLFVGLPFNRGQTRKFPIVNIDEPVQEQVRQLVLEAWNDLREQRSEIPT